MLVHMNRKDEDDIVWGSIPLDTGFQRKKALVGRPSAETAVMKLEEGVDACLARVADKLKDVDTVAAIELPDGRRLGLTLIVNPPGTVE